MAAQLIGMNRPVARGECSCSALATSSLPVPDPPTISTLARAAATSSICRNKSSIGLVWPIIFPNFSLSRTSSSLTRSANFRFSRIADVRFRSSNRSTGFVK